MSSEDEKMFPYSTGGSLAKRRALTNTSHQIIEIRAPKLEMVRRGRREIEAMYGRTTAAEIAAARS